jgi:hypothetical protein
MRETIDAMQETGKPRVHGREFKRRIADLHLCRLAHQVPAMFLLFLDPHASALSFQNAACLRLLQPIPVRPSECVTREDKIVVFHIGFVAGEVGFVLRLVGGFAADESAEPPTARRGILLRVFGRDLNGRGGAGNESLHPAEGCVVSDGGHVLPSQLGYDHAVRERELALPKSLHR